MSATAVAIVESATLAVGIAFGWLLRPLLRRVKDQELQDLSQLLQRTINIEEADEKRNRIRRQLHDAGRRTMRVDSGKPAKIHRMRRR